MSSLQGGINKTSPTAELEIIKHKRAALQKLVKLTAMLHRLHQGLQSVILMGKSAAQIPEKMIQRFKVINESLKNKPTDTLKNTLMTTELRIERDIKHVLEISQKSDALLEQTLGTSREKLADSVREDYYEYVDGFRKKSQTSITLRIALKTRNAILNAFKLPVPESVIQQQLISLEHKEEKCKKLIKRDMASLQLDVSNLINREDCSEEVKLILQKIQEELNLNSQHVNANKPLDEMPMVYESIELSGSAQAVEEVNKIITPHTEQVTEAIVENISTVKSGFFKRLYTWAMSPINTKWKDIE